MKRQPQTRLSNERGSLPLAMLIILVATGLAVLTLPVAVAQARATNTVRQQEQAAQAAQSGLAVAEATLRSSADAGVAGLPCGPIIGTLGDTDVTFRVRIRFFGERPDGQPNSWLDSHELACPAGAAARYVLFDADGLDPHGAPISSAAARQSWRLFELGLRLP